jgi:hypothetical protein
VQTLSTDIHNLQAWIPYAVTAGAFMGSVLVTTVTLLFRFMRSQMTNGDGRTLREAVDNLADDFRDHRHEVRRELSDIKDRLAVAERGNVARHPLC